MKNLLIFILVVTLNFFAAISVGECREVVFVLNTGQSMNASDPFRIAREGIIWSAQNLSADDEVGIVTFNNNANIVRPLSKVGDNPAQNFSADYSGRSNAGAGLLTAIDMLTPKFNTQRDIIFITNGDITNAQSMQNFQAGLKQAQWLNIPVYLIDLRHNAEPINYREYDAIKFLPINYNELLTTLRTILQGDFKTPHISLPTNNVISGPLNFTVPVTAADHLKISLFSIKQGSAQLKNVKPDNIFYGNHVKIFDLNSPATNSFEMNIDFPQGAGVALDVVPTVSGALQTNSTTKFLIYDILEITPVYKKALDTKILSDTFFNGKRVNLRVNDKVVEGVIQNGVIEMPLDEFGENLSLQKIHFEDIGIIFEGDDTAEIVAPKAHYAAWLMALSGILVLAFLAWLIYYKRHKAALHAEKVLAMLDDSEKALPLLETTIKPNKNSDVSYKGKLVLFITKTQEDEDIEPREFDLLRMNAEKIPLSYVLEKCGILGIFPNAKYIFISPNNLGIFLDNQSDCTITKRNVIVEKGTNTALFHNDSVNIASVDETAELIMIYKSLKPAS